MLKRRQDGPPKFQFLFKNRQIFLAITVFGPRCLLEAIKNLPRAPKNHPRALKSQPKAFKKPPCSLQEGFGREGCFMSLPLHLELLTWTSTPLSMQFEPLITNYYQGFFRLPFDFTLAKDFVSLLKHHLRIWFIHWLVRLLVFEGRGGLYFFLSDIPGMSVHNLQMRLPKLVITYRPAAAPLPAGYDQRLWHSIATNTGWHPQRYVSTALNHDHATVPTRWGHPDSTLLYVHLPFGNYFLHSVFVLRISVYCSLLLWLTSCWKPHLLLACASWCSAILCRKEKLQKAAKGVLFFWCQDHSTSLPSGPQTVSRLAMRSPSATATDIPNV